MMTLEVLNPFSVLNVCVFLHSSEEGVPYTVSITAETIVGRGEEACASTDFINQLGMTFDLC